MLLQTARKVVIFVIGATVVLIGIVMIVAPGPAIVVIPAGLAILGTEFVWAKLLLKRMKAKAQGMLQAMGVGGESGSAKANSTPPPEMKDAASSAESR